MGSEMCIRDRSRVNVAPEDVTHIFLTPLQLYTVSNVPRFPNAQICISKRGWIQYHTTHQHPHDDRWFVIPKDVLEYLVFDGWDKVRLLEDEEELASGLRTWWTGGHHRASIAVEIDTKEGVVNREIPRARGAKIYMLKNGCHNKGCRETPDQIRYATQDGVTQYWLNVQITSSTLFYPH